MGQIVTKERDAERGISEHLEPLGGSNAVRDRRLARLRILWAARSFLVRTTGVGLAVFTLVAFLIPKRYESTVQLMPPDSQSGSALAMMAALSGKDSGLGALAGELLGIKSTGALFVGVLRSRTVQDRIVGQFNLKRVYWTRLEDSARKKLADNTEITEDRKSGIINIRVTDHDPKRAAAMAGAYVDQLDRLVAQLTTSSARRERVFLEGRLDTVKQDLNSAEREFSQFASKNATIDLTEQAKATVQASAALQGELIAAESELEGLKQIYTDNNVRVRSTEARIAELRRQLERFNGKPGQAASGSETSADMFTPPLRQLPVLGVPYADFYRRLKVEETVYETLTKEYELAKVQEAKEIPTVKVLDAPEVPEHKSFPPRLLVMIGGTLCTLGVGVCWVLGSASWQEKDPQDPGKAFAEEVLHTLKMRMPRLASNGSRLNLIAQKIRNRSSSTVQLRDDKE